MDIEVKKKELIKQSQELEHELFKLAISPEKEVATRMRIAAELILIYQRLLVIQAVEEGKESVDKLNEILPTTDEIFGSAASLLEKGSEILSGLGERLRGKGR